MKCNNPREQRNRIDMTERFCKTKYMNIFWWKTDTTSMKYRKNKEIDMIFIVYSI